VETHGLTCTLRAKIAERTAAKKTTKRVYTVFCAPEEAHPGNDSVHMGTRCIAVGSDDAVCVPADFSSSGVLGKQSSTYRGVSWLKRDSKWKAQIWYDGNQHIIGYFEDEEEAARAYDKAARAKHGEKAQLNFPTEKQQAAEEAKQQRWIKCGVAPSTYRGVSWEKSSNKWVARIKYDGKQHIIGYFEDEEEAARAYDRAARAHHGEKAHS
jgi:hypothetical protein